MMRSIWLVAIHAVLATLIIFNACLPGEAVAGDIVPPKVNAVTPGGVSIADGSFNYSETDLTIGTLSLQRFIQLTAAIPSDPDLRFYGPGVSNNFDIFVVPQFQRATPPFFPVHYRTVVHMGASASGSYYQDSVPETSSGFTGNNDVAGNGVLQFLGSAYIFTDQGGVIYTFSPSVLASGTVGASGYTQRIDHIAYPDGRVRQFTYVSGNLKMVADSTGYAIVFDWNAYREIIDACGFDLSQTYVTTSTTCAGAALKVSYTYSGSAGYPYPTGTGYLASATDVLGQTEYVGGCLKPPGYSVCKFDYTAGQTSQTFADGSVWHNNFTTLTPPPSDTDYLPPSDGDNEASVTDPNGKVWNYIFTGATPYQFTDPLGRVTQYHYSLGGPYDVLGTTYHNGSILLEVDFPEGNKYVAQNYGPYQTPSKQTSTAKPGSGLADIVVQYGYDYSSGGACSGLTPTSQCTKPITKTDALGNVTNFAYATWGGVLSEMDPAPTSGSARPLKLYDYVQKYAYIKNSGGSLVAAAAPVWLPNSETVCQTAAGSSTASCDTGAPIMVTTYQYGADGTADNLLLRGKAVSAGGTTLRTCYAYDAQGNKTSETKPNANLSVCP